MPRIGTLRVALRKESVDRNLSSPLVVGCLTMSLSARRAWIEMVDYVIDYVNDAVALRKESVDRNANNSSMLCSAVVALRKESVDRNLPTCIIKLMLLMSLSARRAWIEIAAIRLAVLSYYVALRKESVDRNTLHAMFFVLFL